MKSLNTSQTVSRAQVIAYLRSEYLRESSDNFLAEASLAVRMKDAYNAAAQKLKDAGKNALDAVQQQLIKIGDSINRLVDWVVDQIKDFLQRNWDELVNNATAAARLKRMKMKEVVRGMDKKELVSECKNFGATTGFAKKHFVQTVTSNIKTALHKGVNKNESAVISIYSMIVESEEAYNTILESTENYEIPFISEIIHKISHAPIFANLEKIQVYAQRNIEKFLHSFSSFVASNGGPGPFQFIAIASIVAVFIELHIEGVLHHALDWLIGIPGVTMILNIISNISTAIGVVTILEQLIKDGEMDDAEAQVHGIAGSEGYH